MAPTSKCMRLRSSCHHSPVPGHAVPHGGGQNGRRGLRHVVVAQPVGEDGGDGAVEVGDDGGPQRGFGPRALHERHRVLHGGPWRSIGAGGGGGRARQCVGVAGGAVSGCVCKGGHVPFNFYVVCANETEGVREGAGRREHRRL